jgi:hypothetical protein
MLNDFIVRHKSTFSDFYGNLCIKKFIQNFCPNVVLKLFNKCSLGTFPNEKKNIFVKKQRILMNFHIISTYNSEISSELSEYSEWARKKIRNCPNTLNDLEKKYSIFRANIRNLLLWGTHSLTSFIGVYLHFQQCVRYNVYHAAQFYWCLNIVENVVKHQ